VRFVIVDLDRSRSAAQDKLFKSFYRGYIPHVIILDKAGEVVYNQAGEVEESRLAQILDQALLGAPAGVLGGARVADEHPVGVPQARAGDRHPHQFLSSQ